MCIKESTNNSVRVINREFLGIRTVKLQKSKTGKGLQLMKVSAEFSRYTVER